MTYQYTDTDKLCKAITEGFKLVAQAILTLSEPHEDDHGDEESSTVDDAEVRRVMELQRGKQCVGCDRYKSEVECAPCDMCNEKHCCSIDLCASSR